MGIKDALSSRQSLMLRQIIGLIDPVVRS